MPPKKTRSKINRTIVNKILKAHGFPEAKFNDSLLKNIKTEVSDGRLDLTDVFSVTMDGDSTGCRDDSIGWRITEDGGEELLINIIDASNFIPDQSELDLECAKRCCTFYGVGKPVTMLPKRMAFGICSLMPEVDRPAITLIVKFSSAGQHVSSRLVRSLVRCQYALTFAQVNAILQEEVCVVPPGTQHEPVCSLSEAQKSLAVPLRRMRGLVMLLKEENRAKGQYIFSASKLEVCADPMSPQHVLLQTVHTEINSNMMIDVCMNTYNTHAAEFLIEKSSRTIVRVLNETAKTELTTLYRAVRNALPVLAEKDIVTVDELMQIITMSGDPVLRQMILLRLERIIERSSTYACSDTATASDSFCVTLGKKYTTSCSSPARSYVDLVIQRHLCCVLADTELPAEFVDTESLQELCHSINNTLERAAAVQEEFKQLRDGSRTVAVKRPRTQVPTAKHDDSARRTGRQIEIDEHGTIMLVAETLIEVFLAQYNISVVVCLKKESPVYVVSEEVLYSGKHILRFNSPVAIQYTVDTTTPVKSRPLSGKVVKLVFPQIPGLHDVETPTIDSEHRDDQPSPKRRRIEGGKKAVTSTAGRSRSAVSTSAAESRPAVSSTAAASTSAAESHAEVLGSYAEDVSSGDGPTASASSSSDRSRSATSVASPSTGSPFTVRCCNVKCYKKLKMADAASGLALCHKCGRIFCRDHVLPANHCCR